MIYTVTLDFKYDNNIESVNSYKKEFAIETINRNVAIAKAMEEAFKSGYNLGNYLHIKNVKVELYDDINYMKYLDTLTDEGLVEEKEEIYNDCCYYNDCSICPHKFYNFQKLECEFTCMNMKEK